MKKTSIVFKKTASISLAAMLALTVYAPAAAYAAESPDETAAPAAAEPAQQAAPETKQQAASVCVPEAVSEPQAVKEDAPAAEESPYGEATGNWGYGNAGQTTRWAEYTKDGETTLVFSTTGESDLDEDNAVTNILDQNGNSMKNAMKDKVTQVVFTTGITGIGWTALYSADNYEPLYTSDYTVDRTKTDLFKGFTKLTTVIPCETIKRIGWSAFRQCSSLSSFDFTKCPQLEEIMNQAFSDCKSLNDVDLSNCNLLRTIAWSAFNGAGKGSEASLALPTSGVLSVIGGYAFYQYAKNNSAGAEVDFAVVANSVTQILQKAFEGTNIIGEVAGFKNLETLGKDAFKGSRITYTPYDPSQDEPEPVEPFTDPDPEPVVEPDPAADPEPAVKTVTAKASKTPAVRTAETAAVATKTAAVAAETASVSEPVKTSGEPVMASSEVDPRTGIPEDENPGVYILAGMIAAIIMALSAHAIISSRRRKNSK